MVRKSVVLEQLGQIVEAVRARRLSQPEFEDLHGQLSGYLVHEISRFREYGQQFSDPETLDGFTDVVAALERYQELLADLSLDGWKRAESEWEAYLEDAADANRLLVEAAKFLQS